MAFSRYLTLNQIPQLIGSVILGITGNVHVILILFVLLCFVTGTFLETASQVLIYTPLFLPTLKGWVSARCILVFCLQWGPCWA